MKKCREGTGASVRKAYQLRPSGGTTGRRFRPPDPAPPGPRNRHVTPAWDELHRSIADAWPTSRWIDVGVVVGCSGGADSVALLLVLDALRRTFRTGRGFLVVAHFHHGLRGNNADGDRDFTSNLADRLGLPAVSGSINGDDARDPCVPPVRDEASLRARRYAFLASVAASRGARYVAVGHSADDNVETVLHQLLRGTGPAGACGMSTFRDLAGDLVLARPLLHTRRQTIRQALREIGQDWREDATNRDLAYRRNWIRRELIPGIEKRYPHAGDAILRFVETQREWKAVIEEDARQWLEAVRWRRTTDNRGETVATFHWDACRLRIPPRATVVRGLQLAWRDSGFPLGEMSAAHWRWLSASLRSGHPVRRVLPGRVVFAFDGQWAIVTGKPG